MSPADPLFKQRNFLLYMLVRTLSIFGSQMQIVAIGWQLYEKSGNPLHLGLIGLSQFAPFLVMILPAGYAADHFDRRRILMGCYALQLLCSASLAVYTWIDVNSVWPVFAVMTLLGVARAFSMPTVNSLLPNLVATEDYPRALALNSTVNQVSTILGPSVGGVLLLFGVKTVYVSVMACALVNIIAMRCMHPLERRAIPDKPTELQLGSLFAGFRFVRDKPLILGAISLDLVAVLFGGSTALLPVFASDVLHVGPIGLGMLRSATGVGAVLCSVWLSTHRLRQHVGLWMFGSTLVFGISTIVFGASASFTLSLIALVFLGISDTISVFIRQYLMQLVTPDAIRGRVNSVAAIFVGASNELGEFESGTTAAWWGTVPAVLVGGGMTVGMSLLWMKLFPALRKLDRFPEPVR